MDELEPDLRTRLHGETAKIAWPELERHFARGVVVAVAPELDLVEVAFAMASDDKSALEGWLQSQQVAPVSEAQALDYVTRQPTFWAVVVAPWVVIQEARPKLDS